MKIVIDENIIYADEFFNATALGQSVTVVKKSGRSISNADLVDADILLVRSVTQVNKELLHNTQVKFVGTATIGTEHVDTQYLHDNNITFADAGGCSKYTVAQYVVSCILALRPQYFVESFTTGFIKGCTEEVTKKDVALGVVGYGNIGKALTKIALKLGWHVKVYDPFVQASPIQGMIQVQSLQDLCDGADVVSLHVPHTTAETSQHPTQHLFNEQTLGYLDANTLLINSARGKVICEQSLLADITKTNREVVLDVFEHEPVLHAKLIEKLALATPHIAGYSVEGKARGTQMMYDAVCKHLGTDSTKTFEGLLPQAEQIAPHSMSSQELIAKLYDVRADNEALKTAKDKYHTNAEQMSQAFDNLRKNYKLRREWHAHGIHL